MQSTSINRNAIILLPKQPALDWIMQADPHPLPDFTLEDLRQEQDVYLLPNGQINTPEEAQQWALRNFSVLFEAFLQDWYIDEAMWPKRRTRKMFQEWFDVQYHSMIWDLSPSPIEHESWD